MFSVEYSMFEYSHVHVVFRQENLFKIMAEEAKSLSSSNN